MASSVPGAAAATNASIPSRPAAPCALLPRPMLFRSTARGKIAERIAATGAAVR